MKGAQRESSHFTVTDCGSLTVTNIDENGEQHFFKVTKRLVLNSNFIVIEKMEHAPYQILSNSENVGISYAQVES